MQCTRHLPAMSNWNRMQWNMPTVDGLRLIEGQSNCSKGREFSCSCSCFWSEKYDRYYLHFFGILMHVLSLSLSLFPPLVLVLSSFVASQTHLLRSLSCALPSALFLPLFTSLFPSLHMLFIYLTSILHLNLSWGLKHLSTNSSSSINLSCCYKIISFSGHKGQAHLLCRPPPFFQVQLLCK